MNTDDIAEMKETIRQLKIRAEQSHDCADWHKKALDEVFAEGGIVKQRDKRIAELIEERDQERELVSEMREYVQSANAVIEQWIEAFDMELRDDGVWEWGNKILAAHHELQDRHQKLAAQWNKFVRQYNDVVAPRNRNFGRPLAASRTQTADVLKRKKAGQSLRAIVDETGLGLQTVRTIIDKADNVDRATMARLQRIAPSMADAHERVRRRMRDRLPRAIAKLQKQAKALLKEAADQPACRKSRPRHGQNVTMLHE